MFRKSGSRMTKRAALVALATVGIAAAASSNAHANSIWTSDYCGWVVAPNSPCSDSRNGTNMIANVARYSGAGSVSVCQRVISLEGGNTLSRRCAIGVAGSETDLNAYPFAQKYATVGNDSNYRHTINGTAWFT